VIVWFVKSSSKKVKHVDLFALADDKHTKAMIQNVGIMVSRQLFILNFSTCYQLVILYMAIVKIYILVHNKCGTILWIITVKILTDVNNFALLLSGRNSPHDVEQFTVGVYAEFIRGLNGAKSVHIS